MLLYYLYAASAVIIALVYMLFDVFNHREVPNIFAYASLLFAFAVLPLSGNWNLLVESYLIAFVLLGLGYFIYRVGELGLGDVFELAALSLLLAPLASPIVSQAVPIATSLPPIVALFLNTGIAAVIVIPLFYLGIVLGRFGSSMTKWVSRSDVIKAAAVVAAYVAFAALLAQISHARVLLLALILLIVLGSALLLVFQRAITEVMVERVGVSGFLEDDIIAFNLMSGKEIAAAKRSVGSFDRLVTRKMIAEMKRKKIKQKFPVYKSAVPFAVPIFIGVVLTLLFGNLLLLALLG
jgi:Flp pilus assembly protein protease CpaA